MKLLRVLSDYRWPIYIGAHLTMSIVACGVLVWVATRPDAPRPIPAYYETAEAWDQDEAIEESSRALGWTVRYELPADVPHVPGMPRPIDVHVATPSGDPVSGLTGRLIAIRPADSRLSQSGDLVALPGQAGAYRTLVLVDEPGAWDFRLDAKQQALRFVSGTRVTVSAADAAAAEGAAQ